jgi:hypothetical protein
MKLNNHGWGTRDFVIYMCVLVLILLFVTISISSMYKGITDSTNKTKTQQTVEEKQPNEEPKKNVIIDYKLYESMETKIYMSTYDYMEAKHLNTENDILNITTETLISEGYLDSSVLVDQNGEKCSGYSNVYDDENGHHMIKSYVTCGGLYTTEGY